ncbi:MAG: hypothetical protein JST92_26090, partial [Deltaproteobacteria bacterium]|nr:hypothetical protein [Deltaproteobacteria bacterium]
MRRLALCLVLVVAGCKGAAPRPLPAASWARGTALWIHTDPNHNWADMPERSRPYAESDLRSAGFEIANRPGAFDVLLKSDGDDALDLVVLRDEKPIDTIRTAYNDWACHKFPATNLSIECTGREIASHLIDSPALAKAAREQQPAAAAPRPSTAKSLSGKLAVL